MSGVKETFDKRLYTFKRHAEIGAIIQLNACAGLFNKHDIAGAVIIARE